ncbi:type IVB secretion system protein IcmH/DotU [Azospirillum rugosum]|uniref:Type VI secretion system protein ImpK n=2 Tax=Azospirillum rugosum TaxID=416170 RepID=A0ABS4SI45_9PROT|nr:type IVB secretion system protein IcmH/DotU [Azospirillum rugosum]MBP2292246.1 type VI secretion system protein ImpK [Azospirillum rugosum]MDQ0526005.1 type VI secretion system protein ImpK [Azospirillum rugosum]
MGTDERVGDAAVRDGETSAAPGLRQETGRPEGVRPEMAPPRALPAFLAAGPAAWGGSRGDGRRRDRARADAPPILPARLRGATNPLLAAAAPLLDLAAGLREQAGLEDSEGLRDQILADLARFEAEAAAAGLSAEEVRVARFALCATLDDVVRATPWGARCRWAREGLVALVDREAGGPERFYDLLDTMLSDPRLHRPELELFYACLSLGFEGKFRDKPRGAHDHAHLRDELYRVLRRLRGERDRTLSPQWRGVAERFRPLGLALPPWLAAVAVAALLAMLYVEWGSSLAGRAEPLAARLSGLLPDRPIEIVRGVPPPPPTAVPSLAVRVTSLLQPEIRSGAVAVLSGDDGALVIRVEGAGMFATASDVVKARYRAVVDRVGQALGPEAGRVVVVAHTDEPPPGSGPFPTLQALTEARALAVRRILERTVGAPRLSSEGRGDRDPVATNATSASRGANRRVDVRLYPE